MNPDLGFLLADYYDQRASEYDKIYEKPEMQKDYAHLRHWLKQQHQTTPSEAQMSELLSQVAACTTRGHAIAIKIGWGMVVREGDRLGFHA